jgi:MOSC domain-containing protein YiiM
MEVVVTEPRMPCYKLGIRFGRADIIKRFLASRRTGFYFAVAREGMVGAGDAVAVVGREQEEISVADITRLYALGKNDLKTLRRALEVEALPEGWKGFFRHQIEKQTG